MREEGARFCGRSRLAQNVLGADPRALTLPNPQPPTRSFTKLISLSKNINKHELQPFEYSKSPLLRLLGFRESKRLGKMVRVILEEGRRRKLVEAGFGNARLVEYVAGDVTGDNLAIVGTRGPIGRGNKKSN